MTTCDIDSQKKKHTPIHHYGNELFYLNDYANILQAVTIGTGSLINGEIKIRPMMYLALSYDHRIVDGKEAVSFLKNIKDFLEEPKRLFLNV